MNVAKDFPKIKEEISDRKRVRRRRSILQEFSMNTSTHGIPGIARSESVTNRIFWSISLIGFTGVMFYFIIEAIRAYFNYPTQTSIDIIPEWPQYFPAFTLCNISPIRFDGFIEPFLNYTGALNGTKVTDINSFSKAQAGRIQGFLQTKINAGESLDSMFFPLSSMLIYCNFNGKACSSNDFVYFISAAHGMCYTFNAKMKNTTNGNIRYSHEGGGSGKLTLRLYAHGHQYVPYYKEGVGMIVMVHDNTELPRIHVAGMELAPGLKHRLTYTKKTVFLLAPPYTDCTSDVSPALEAMFNYYRGADYAYSEVICLTNCIQAHNYHRCGCINPSQWDARSVVLPGTNKVIVAPLCNVSDTCFIEATNTLMSVSSIMDEYCSACKHQCVTTNFILKKSSSKTPQQWLLEDIKNFVEKNSSIPLYSNWSTEWQDQIQENYLSIELIREVTLVENYTQAATLTAVDVLSNVGGQTGLWIGISFLSLMEFIEMLYRILRHTFHSIWNH